jgi:fluoride ion exporter CrcB/FEX
MMGNTITNIVGTFVWGYFGESKGVLKTLLVVVSAGLVAGILGFGSTNSTILLIFMLLIGLCDRGMETIAGPALI